jgi:exopolysaccharide biosynthesis polyprenyl glycosylphosphotransferase
MSEAPTSRAIRLLTIISDLLLMNLAFAFAYVVRYELQWLVPTTFTDPYSRYLPQQVLLTALLIITYSQQGVWSRRRGDFWAEEVSRVVYATAAGVVLMVAATFFFRPLAFSRLLLIWAWLFTSLFIALARLVRRVLLTFLYQAGIGVDRVLVVGGGEVGRGVMRTLLARPDLGYRAIGYLDDAAGENNIGLGRIPHLGAWSDLARTLAEEPRIHTVFLALPGGLHQQISELARQCQEHGVRVHVVPDLLDLSLNRVESSSMAGLPLLSVREVSLSRAGQVLKRVADLTVVLLGAIPALVVGGVIALAIRLESGGPVFYVSDRVGQHGRPFPMIKFRSMVLGAEALKDSLLPLNEASGPIFKIRDDPRLTRVGRVIRRLSLDELPQLANILLGQMSLVGPRPPLAEEVSQYQPWHRQRLEVKGGLTGLWQVSGRSDLTFDEQCLLDIYYIENWSLGLDFRILLQTIPFTLFSRGAY